MRKRILLIGQCTLHWGRMEFGNIGNYYIVEPFVRELHKVFPDAEIRTTFQMTDEFCQRENVVRLPMGLYYAWKKSDLCKCVYELAASWVYRGLKLPLLGRTAFMKECWEADLIVDFSGDIWSDNADFVGPRRFFIGACKDYIGHLSGRPLAMLAGSPGPFKGGFKRWLAKKVFSKFDLVTNREPVSTELLTQDGFDMSNVQSFACPAFLFEGHSDEDMQEVYQREGLRGSDRPVVGFIICGWNMLEGPFSKWPRKDEEYSTFADALEYIINELGARVCLMSHSNGFELPPAFKMIHGRDYPLAKQLHEIMTKRGFGSDVFLIEGIHLPTETKAILRQFNMLVTGRVHAACAGLSQCVPTVIIDYGHEPKAHKLRGFAEVAGVSEYLADPGNSADLIEKIEACWQNRDQVRSFLAKRMTEVKELARQNFRELAKLNGK